MLNHGDNLRHPVGGRGNQQRIGPRFRHDADFTTGRVGALKAAQDHIRQLRRIGIVDLDHPALLTVLLRIQPSSQGPDLVTQALRAKDQQRVGSRVHADAGPVRNNAHRLHDLQNLACVAIAQADHLDRIRARLVKFGDQVLNATEVAHPIRQDDHPRLRHRRNNRLGRQKRPDHIHHLGNGDMSQADYAGFIKAGSRRPGRQLARRVERHDPVRVDALDDGQAVDLQHVEEDFVKRGGRHGAGGQHGDRAPHTGIDDEVSSRGL